jgi:hypothetical protein
MTGRLWIAAGLVVAVAVAAVGVWVWISRERTPDDPALSAHEVAVAIAESCYRIAPPSQTEFWNCVGTLADMPEVTAGLMGGALAADAVGRNDLGDTWVKHDTYLWLTPSWRP